jgi:hypothetical protein
VVATFSDADPAGTVGDYTATINWGDGSTPTSGTIAAAAGGFTVSGKHAYDEEGTYQIQLVIQDQGGSSATATSTAMTYDHKLQALEAIMSEWGRTDLGTATDPMGYQARVNDLLGPSAGGTSAGKNGSYDLNGTTVHSSGARYTLSGAPSPLLDWFFASSLDLVKNQRSGEVVTRIV